MEWSHAYHPIISTFLFHPAILAHQKKTPHTNPISKTDGSSTINSAIETAAHARVGGKTIRVHIRVHTRVHIQVHIQVHIHIRIPIRIHIPIRIRILQHKHHTAVRCRRAEPKKRKGRVIIMGMRMRTKCRMLAVRRRGTGAGV